MKIGKFKKILVAGLVCALSFGLINSTKMVNAEDNGSSETIERIDNPNVNTSKTVTYNTESGMYDITLESFITGEVQQGEPIPTDIVLVLDVSGSMAENDFPVGESKVEYNKLRNNTNSKAFENRNNLYIKNNNGEYIKVKVERSGIFGNYKYTYTADGFDTKTNNGNDIPSPYSGNLYVYSETTETITRLSALQNAVNSFIDATAAANAQISDSNKQHRISLVKFAGKKSGSIGNDTYRDDGFTYNYTQIVKNLTVVDTSGASQLISSVKNLNAAGATSADYGLDQAQTVLNGSTEGRNKVVIMFTDGEPNHGNDFDNEVAADTISKAKDLKDDGVKVYTIGTLDGLDPSDDTDDMNKYMHATSSNFPNATASGYNGNYWGSGAYFTVNFGSGSINNGYYKVATNSDSLNNIFEEISDDISVPSIDLDSSTILMDQLSDYFEFPDGFGKEDVKVYTAKCKTITGTGSNKEYDWYVPEQMDNLNITVDEENKKVSVSGFDYKENFVGFESDQTTVRGKKIIVKFSVKPIDGFIGGNGVSTNDPSSGIYNNNQVVEHFVRPTTDVALNYYFGTNNTGIYITDDWTDFKYLIKEFAYTTSEESIDYNHNLSEKFVNDYVDIVYTIKDDETIIGTLTVPAGTDNLSGCVWVPQGNYTTSNLTNDEKKYTIEVSVTPTVENRTTNDEIPDNSIQPSNHSNSQAKLYIFKPTVVSHDIINDVLLGSTVSDLDEQIDDIDEWKCNTNDEGINTSIIHNSEKPKLTFKVTPCDQESVNEYTTTKIGYQKMEYTVHGHDDIDITAYTTATHDNALEQCHVDEGNSCSDKHFYMNVVGGTITIDKVLDLSNGNLQVDESDGTPIFTFKIDKVNGNDVLKSYYKTVELSKIGNEWKLTEPVQITGLDVGTYKVTELSSMRYKFESVEVDDTNYDTDGQKVSLDSSKKNATYEYTNIVKSTEYDSDNGYLVNKVVKNEDGSYSMVASENSEK